MDIGMRLQDYLRSARHRSARKLMLVGNRIGNPLFNNVSNTVTNYTQFQQYAVFPVIEDCVNPEFDFINARLGTTGPSNLTLKVGMGTSTTSPRVNGTWASSGTATAVIAPGAVDTVRFTGSFAKGSKIYLVYFGQYDTPIDAWATSGYTSSLDANEAGNSLTDKTAATGAWLSGRAVTDTLLRPIAMRGYVTGVASALATVALTGDSIASGAVSDDVGGTFNGLSYAGWANRALAQLNCSWTNNGYGGLTASVVAGESTTNQAIRTAASYNSLNGVQIAILALGTNDLSATTTALTYQQLQANIQTLVARNTAKGIKTIVCTATPRTNTGNTATVVPYRLQFNAWVRANYGNMCFDVAALTQDPINNDLWRTDLGTPCDSLGVHPTGVLHTAIANAFVAQFPSFLAATPAPVVTALKFASNRTQFAAGSGVISTVGTLWQADKVTFQAPSDWDMVAPIVTWPAFYCGRQTSTDETALSNDLQIRNASLFINGVFAKAFTFGGQGGVTIPANSATPWVQNDRDPTMVIPRGSKYSIVTQTYLPATGQYRLTTYYGGADDATAASGVSNRDAYVNGTTAFVPASIGAQLYGPCAIVAEGWTTGRKPVPLIVGDSIGFGKNDDNALLATEQVFGYVNRAMIDTSGPGRYSYGNFCVPGTRLDGLSDARFGWRKAILQSLGMPFTCVYVEMGINTPTASRIPDWEGIAGPFLQSMAGTKDIIGGTLLPQSAILNNSSGTDYVNQTALNNDVWNNYVKAAGGGVTKFFTKYVNNTPAFQDGSNPGKWPVPSYTTTLAVALTGASSTDFIVNNPAPAVDDALVLNPGQANKTTKMVKAVVDLGDGTSRVSTYFAFAATMAVGTPVKATNSEDGTHPTTQISKAGKAPLVAAKAAGIFT